MSDPERDVVGVAERIQRYLERHGRAADTVEGIASWWLRDAGSVPLGLVQQALDCLVARGIVVRRIAPGGRVVYAKAQSCAFDDAGGAGNE